MRRAALVVAAGTASAAGAQDLPATQLADHGQVVLQDSMTRSLLRQRGAAIRRPTARQVETCAAKQRYRAQHGAGHPLVRKLYGLCRGDGL